MADLSDSVHRTADHSDAPLPPDEDERLGVLKDSRILDTLPDADFDDLTRLAAQICGTPIALISLVDETRQWFKSRVGVDAMETPRRLAFCAHAILDPTQLLVVPDATQDARFSANELVTGPMGIRFYAGAPLVMEGGHALGTLCVIDKHPRELTAGQQEALAALARQVVSQIQLRRQNRALEDARAELQEFFTLPLDMLCVAGTDGYFKQLNPAFSKTLGYTEEELLASSFLGFVHPEDVSRTVAETERLVAGLLTADFENRYRCKDGSYRWLSWKCAPGTNGLIHASARDVTERKRMSELQRGILDSAAYAVIATTPEGVITEFNPAAQRMLGYSAAEMVGRATPAVFHDAEEVTARAVRLSKELGCVIEPGFEVFVAKTRRHLRDEREWTYIRKDGTRFPVHLSVTALWDGPERIVGFLGIASDITERRRAEAQTIASEKRFREAIEYSAIGMALVGLDGSWLKVNRALCAIVGRSEEELLRCTFQDITHPDDLHADLANVQALIAGSIDHYQMEKRYLDQHGRVIPVLLAVTLVRDSEGQPVYFVSQVEDISQRIVAEARLVASERRFRDAVEFSAIGMALVALDGTWLKVNRALCAILGRSEAELQRCTFQDITHADDLEVNVGQAQALIAGTITHYQMEKRYLHRDGHFVWALVAVTLVHDSDSQPAYFVTQVTDITARLEAERRLKASLVEKETLLQEIHHRVKNNLQVVSSLLSLQSGYIHDPELLAQFQECQSRIRSMALIHEKLYQSETLARVDLKDYLESLARIVLSTYAAGGNVRLKLALEPVSTDIDTAVPLGLLVHELLTNAVKYAFPDHRTGRVCLALQRGTDADFTLSVEDDGVGLPEGFDPAHASSLGLRLVGMFVKQLRAELRTHFAPGQTSFSIRCKGALEVARV